MLTPIQISLRSLVEDQLKKTLRRETLIRWGRQGRSRDGDKMRVVFQRQGDKGRDSEPRGNSPGKHRGALIGGDI